MKSIYIIILAVIIVGGLVWFNLPPKEASAPVVPTSTETTGETTSADDMNMTAEEHANMEQEDVSVGTDIGMELPETDMTGTVSTSKKMFTVNGSNFAFDIKEIRVKEGDVVTIHFMSADGFHDLVNEFFLKLLS